MLGVAPGWIKAFQGNPLIANHATVPVVGSGIDSAGVYTAYGARDKKRARLMHLIQPGEIQIPAVHHVESTRLDRHDIQYVDVAHFAVAQVNERGDIPA